MSAHSTLYLVISCLCLACVVGLASVPSRDSRGIAPQDEGYYGSSLIECKDRSKKFTREKLNDEFCDCSDGTDEPGTSACPEGKFYCQNAGHIPLMIFSSRVNDGICDCCDGSDEYDGKANCRNTCWEAGKVAREKLKKKIKTYQDGITIRKQEVEKAKQAFAKDEAELSKLESEENILKGLVQKLKEHKERIDKAEEEERRKKEEEKSIKEAEKNSSELEKPFDESLHDESEGAYGMLSESQNLDALKDSHHDKTEAENHQRAESKIHSNQKMGEVVEDHVGTFVETSDDAGSGESSSGKAEKLLGENEDDLKGEEKEDDDAESNEAASDHEAEQEQAGSVDTEGLSREELGQLVASRWTGENVAQKRNEVDNTANEQNHEDDLDIDNEKEEYDSGYDSETDGDKHKFDDDSDDEYEEEHFERDGSYNPSEDDEADFSDSTLSGSQSWLQKIQQTVQNIIQTFDLFRTPVNVSEAARVRKEYDDSSSKLSKMQSRISRLTTKLKHDYGKEKEFYLFYDQCFENKQDKLLALLDARYVYKVCPFKQASQVEGHRTTPLGHWDKFEDSYRVMLFSHGDRCWNGPDRSLKVNLRCGLKNELTDVDEPSRCEYVALLSTPALCQEEKLKELQQKLEQMNSSQPPNHDEL